jgi:hypothetical protein
MNELVSLALKLAAAEVGVRETAGQNRGPEVDGYSVSIGHDPQKGDPYCAIFCAAMFRRAADQLGIRSPVPMVAGCFTLEERSPAIVHTQVPVPGAIFILNGHQHAGLVESLLGAFLVTVEANTNVNGSAHGDGVYRRERHQSEIMMYLDYSRIDMSTLLPVVHS